MKKSFATKESLVQVWAWCASPFVLFSAWYILMTWTSFFLPLRGWTRKKLFHLKAERSCLSMFKDNGKWKKEEENSFEEANMQTSFFFFFFHESILFHLIADSDLFRDFYPLRLSSFRFAYQRVTCRRSRWVFEVNTRRRFSWREHRGCYDCTFLRGNFKSNLTISIKILFALQLF